MKRTLILFMCGFFCLATFAQNEKKQGDDMASAGNYSGAAMMYRLCMEQDEECLFRLIRLLYEKKIEPQAPNELFLLVNPPALNGNAEAQLYLGILFNKGIGVSEDNREALKWIQKSVDQGYADAQNEFGKMHQMGLLVSRNDAEAVKLYQLSAEQGHVEAQYNLGYMYHKQLGIKKDKKVQPLKEAVKWYEKSANQGNSKAQNCLGLMYQQGEGVKKNIQEAVVWFQKSAGQGNAEGQYNLGLLYEMGQGVVKNMDKAIDLYQKASAQGHKLAAAKVKKLKRK